VVRSPGFWAVVFFLLTTWLYTANNEFGVNDHPDESGKARQIVDDTRNFHHPLLLLSATQVLATVAPRAGDDQPLRRAAIQGRNVSALFSSLSLLALAALAFAAAGFGAACCVGLFAILNTTLFELAHFMKEDTALLLGVALSLLSFQLFWRRRTLGAVVFSGVACALAVSGKYVGLMMLPFALFVILRPRASAGDSPAPPSRVRRLGVFAIALLATIGLINFRAVAHPRQAWQSLHRETRVAIEGHKGFAEEDPSGYYLVSYWKQTGVPVLILGAAHLLLLARRRRTASSVEWIPPTFCVALVVLLSVSTKVALRYLLPVLTLTHYFAGRGAWELAAALSNLPRFGARSSLVRLGLATAIGATAVMAHASRLIRSYQGFQIDDREELKDWIRTSLPRHALIAADSRVNLPVAGRREFAEEGPLPQRVLSATFVADVAISRARRDESGRRSLEKLLAMGVTHVVVCRASYSRFFSEDLRPIASMADLHDDRLQFYADLFRRGRLLWTRPLGPVNQLHPGLSVYQISAADH
jgi:hypothetical protein